MPGPQNADLALGTYTGGTAPKYSAAPGPMPPISVGQFYGSAPTNPAAPIKQPPVTGTSSATNPYSFDTNPNVALQRALENQGIGQLDTWLKAAREQAIIASGDPGLAAQAGFGLDPQAGVFAQQNYLSGNADLARVDRAKQAAHRAIINKLAARGLLRSGDLGYQEGESNIDFGNQEYDVRQAVLKKLSDMMQQYLQQKQALKQATVTSLQNAYQDYVSQPSLLTAAQQPVVPGAQPGILPYATPTSAGRPVRRIGGV